MRRVIVIFLAGVALSGCASSSFSVPGLDFLKPSPPVATLQLDSAPPGAEARTSAGPSCRTPCSVSVPAAPLSVTYTLDRYEPQTVSVQPVQQTVSPTVDTGTSYVLDLDPNPVFAELAPTMAPPKRATKRPPSKRVARQPPAAAAPPPADTPPPPAPSTPFPSATGSSPFPSR